MTQWSAIPVADAWARSTSPAATPLLAGTMPPAYVARAPWLRWRDVLLPLLVALVLANILTMFANFGASAQVVIEQVRRVQWLLILIALTVQLKYPAGAGIMRVMRPLLPFFLIGLVSAVAGTQPLVSLKFVLFWWLYFIAAAVAGSRLPTRWGAWSVLLFLLGCAVVSAAIALVLPRFGVQPTSAGTPTRMWRGVFAAKNSLGLVCACGMCLALFVPGRWWTWSIRAVAMAIFAVCLWKAHSAGGLVVTAVGVGFGVLLFALRRTPFSGAIKVAIAVLVVLAALGLFFALQDRLLLLLGKEATLTGRTVFWHAFLDRALDYWVLGAGPGTFSGPSWVTVDILLRYGSLGTILTPHNIYIAALGEIGVFGLIAYVLPLLYFAFVAPFVWRSVAGLLAGIMAFSLLALGWFETAYGLYNMGLLLFLVVYFSATALRDSAAEGRIAGGRNAPLSA